MEHSVSVAVTCQRLDGLLMVVQRAKAATTTMKGDCDVDVITWLALGVSQFATFSFFVRTLQHKLKCITSHKLNVVQTNILHHIQWNSANLLTLDSNRGRDAGEKRGNRLTLYCFSFFSYVFFPSIFCITQSKCMRQLGGVYYNRREWM